MAKKSSSFNKHVYTLIAVIILLVAAGIASYATAPPGAATHAKLYTDEIWGKSGSTLIVKDNLNLDGMIAAGPILLQVNAINAAGHTKGIASSYIGNQGTAIEGTILGNSGAGIKGISQSSLSSAVEGSNTASSNTGKLGTANAGVEGTSAAGNTGMIATSTAGVVGTGSNNGVSGSSPNTGVYGQSTSSGAGVRGNSNSGYGVQAYSTTGDGLYSTTLSSTKYAGKFEGGKGLFASKIGFGTSAFSKTGVEGALILGASSTYSCASVCDSHGLICSVGYSLAGGDVGCGTIGVALPGPTTRYCWCD